MIAEPCAAGRRRPARSPSSPRARRRGSIGLVLHDHHLLRADAVHDRALVGRRVRCRPVQLFDRRGDRAAGRMAEHDDRAASEPIGGELDAADQRRRDDVDGDTDDERSPGPVKTISTGTRESSKPSTIANGSARPSFCAPRGRAIRCRCRARSSRSGRCRPQARERFRRRYAAGHG